MNKDEELRLRTIVARKAVRPCRSAFSIMTLNMRACPLRHSVRAQVGGKEADPALEEAAEVFVFGP